MTKIERVLRELSDMRDFYGRLRAGRIVSPVDETRRPTTPSRIGARLRPAGQPPQAESELDGEPPAIPPAVAGL
jgi:hypothetical protein